MNDKISTKITRRGFLSGVMAVLIIRPKMTALLSNDNDPIKREFAIAAPPNLVSRDSLLVTWTSIEGTRAQWKIHARCSFTALDFILHESGRGSVRDEHGNLWPMDHVG